MPSTATQPELGMVGYISDTEPHRLAPNAWSDMENVRCVDGSIASFPGHDAIGPVSIIPQTLTAVKTSQRTWLTYANDDKIYAQSAGVEEDISGYTYSTGGRWDSCTLGGVAILNNGINNPQYWGGAGLALNLPYDSVDDPGNPCTWDDMEMSAKIIRPFKFHLFAFDIDDCSGRNRRRLWWSHPAEPGTLPITWDITKADYDAGDAELSETSGYILDALQLRDTMVVYLDDAIYSLTYTGRQDRQIFNIRNVTTSQGIYARNCVCDIGGVHFLVTDGDIVLFDGNQFTSIADKRIKRAFFDNVSRSTYERTFCQYYHRTGEVWLCYPTPGDLYCTQALVWNKDDNTWTKKPIPPCLDATFAVIDRTSTYTWATLPYATWADWGTNPASPLWTTWGEPIDNAPIFDSLVLGGETSLYEMDVGNQADGVNQLCYAQRIALDFGDKADAHMVVKLRPHAEGDPFRVRIGSQMSVTDPVTWSGYQTFDPANDYQIDFRVTGRLHAIEYSSEADVSWKVSGHDVDFEKVSRR